MNTEAIPAPLTPAEMLLSPEEALARKSASPGPLEELFFAGQGRRVIKWLHYLPLYEQAFERFRGTPVRMLELGVMHGGSLDLWRRYFGPEAVLYGIDINPACATRVDPPSQVRIGSQADPEFLASVVEQMGGVDIVLDDGSHVASHQRASFAALWPLLSVGGLYVIEDMHTSYWRTWEGGYQQPGTAVELVKTLIDDLHGWYHDQGSKLVPRDQLGPITVGDSIAFIPKVRRLAPGWAKSGG